MNIERKMLSNERTLTLSPDGVILFLYSDIVAPDIITFTLSLQDFRILFSVKISKGSSAIPSVNFSPLPPFLIFTFTVSPLLMDIVVMILKIVVWVQS